MWRGFGKPAALSLSIVIILAACIVSVSPLPLSAKSYRYEETIHKDFSSDGISKVIFVNSRGDISIKGVSGKSGISLEAVKRVRVKNEERAREIAKLMKLETKIKGDALIIKAVYPRRKDISRGFISMLFGGFSNYEIRMDVAVDEKLDVEISVASGDVSVSGVLGRVNVSSASGDVNIANSGEVRIVSASGDVHVAGCQGELNVSTASGDVTIGNIKGKVKLQTSSGDFDIKKIDGDLALSTASGDADIYMVDNVDFSGVSGSVHMNEVFGSVDASSSSGEIFVECEPEGEGDFKISTSSGDVVLKFKKPLPGGFKLDAETSSGDITAYLPIDISRISRNRLVGVVGDGKNSVSIHTASGDIKLEQLKGM